MCLLNLFLLRDKKYERQTDECKLLENTSLSYEQFYPLCSERQCSSITYESTQYFYWRSEKTWLFYLQVELFAGQNIAEQQ